MGGIQSAILHDVTGPLPRRGHWHQCRIELLSPAQCYRLCSGTFAIDEWHSPTTYQMNPHPYRALRPHSIHHARPRGKDLPSTVVIKGRVQLSCDADGAEIKRCVRSDYRSAYSCGISLDPPPSGRTHASCSPTVALAATPPHPTSIAPPSRAPARPPGSSYPQSSMSSFASVQTRATGIPRPWGACRSGPSRRAV
jgi:hypothetical protein